MWTNKRLVRLGGIIHHVGLACTFRTSRIPTSLPPLQPRRAPVVVETHSPHRFSEWPEDGPSPLKLCRQNPHDRTFIDRWYVLIGQQAPSMWSRRQSQERGQAYRAGQSGSGCPVPSAAGLVWCWGGTRCRPWVCARDQDKGKPAALMER